MAVQLSTPTRDQVTAWQVKKLEKMDYLKGDFDANRVGYFACTGCCSSYCNTTTAQMKNTCRSISGCLAQTHPFKRFNP